MRKDVNRNFRFNPPISTRRYDKRPLTTARAKAYLAQFSVEVLCGERVSTTSTGISSLRASKPMSFARQYLPKSAGRRPPRTASSRRKRMPRRREDEGGTKGGLRLRRLSATPAYCCASRFTPGTRRRAPFRPRGGRGCGSGRSTGPDCRR